MVGVTKLKDNITVTKLRRNRGPDDRVLAGKDHGAVLGIYIANIMGNHVYKHKKAGNRITYYILNIR